MVVKEYSLRTLRRIAELISRGRVIKRRIKVKGRLETIFVSPDAQLKYLLPGTASFDQDLVLIAETFVTPGCTVWDIGANVGTFSVAAASMTGEGLVLAVEADPWLAELLNRTSNHSTHKRRNMRVLCTAISDKDGVDEFLIAQRGRASSALQSAGGHSQMGGARQVRAVPTLRIDTVATRMPPPKFMKIDIEGAEAAALRGAETMMRKHQPVVYAEVSRSNFQAIQSLCAAANYAIFDSNGNAAEVANDSNYFLVPANDATARECILRFASRRSSSKH